MDRAVVWRLGWAASVGTGIVLLCVFCALAPVGTGSAELPGLSGSVGLEAVPSGQRAGRAGGGARQLLPSYLCGCPGVPFIE